MDRDTLFNELTKIIGEYLRIRGLDLVELICRYQGRDLSLRVLADKPQGGINLEECACLNNVISQILNERDFLKERYILEVSSPGLDRPLKIKSDFLRCINRKVKFFLNEAVKNQIEWDGVIVKVQDDAVDIDIEQEILQIPLFKINKAKQIISYC